DNNAKIHTSKFTECWFYKNNIVQLPWLSYSPDLNPIKYLWDKLEHHVHKHISLSSNESELFNLLQNKCFKIDGSIIKNLVESIIYTLSSEALIPDQKYKLLFNINQPIELFIQEFDTEWWPLLLNVWTEFNHKKKVNGDLSKTYTYRFTKNNESSTQKDEVPSEK
ncbi:hypothetical protein C2G38_1966020, partial [Gigaspora rosea]